MLDIATKRRIDTCRDILVGKVPDPKSQVEQITIALIYKFMDDMDAEAEELGGSRTFFAGNYEKYGWTKLMAPNMGGFDVLALYSEAIQKMNENPGIPALFRDIFKNAYLPYRDPETLRSFLKEINGFTYDHSERLGDAFEYLLSVLGSQGDAGQFRTPRHIIDFMVEIIDPKKDESILDPACGTAGFLISAWKHILKQNTSKPTPPSPPLTGGEFESSSLDKGRRGRGLPLTTEEGGGGGIRTGDLLTPDERKRLAANIHGYDISPDMVRLSLVNMYLHGFTDPHIEEYDTLTSEEKWNEYADVIMANPPFMSPKGGIKPHKRFSVQATRSEVLFVDYMAEQLTPNGRAAIIVPEGIIFQSGSAYKKLREMLVKTSLVAVVSLPAGVFNPYSGVKTSILFLDKRLAKTRDSVLFAKVESDGFNLGAQRRAIEKNDLPAVAAAVKVWLTHGPHEHNPNLLVVEKERIGENGEWNLSGERYRNDEVRSSNYELVALGDVCEVVAGQSPDGQFYNKVGEGLPFYQGKTEFTDRFIDAPKRWTTQITKTAYPHDILMSVRAPVGPVNLCSFECCIGRGLAAIRPKNYENTLYLFIFHVLKSLENKINGNAGAAFASINKKEIEAIQIPFPPLEVQKEIVAEIEGYQKIIDGARQVIENYQPRISIDPDWPVVAFQDAPFEIIDGDRGNNYPSKEDFSPDGYCLFLNTKNVRPNGFAFDELAFISQVKDGALRKGKLSRGDVLLTTRGTVGNTAIFDDNVPYEHIRINSGMLIFRPEMTKILGEYIFQFFQSGNFRQQMKNVLSGSAQPQLPIRDLNSVTIPLPDLDIQRAIVAKIEEEQRLVNANKELIRIFEEKIKTTINRVWGEDA
jgi:type I restriction enzyme M protein